MPWLRRPACRVGPAAALARVQGPLQEVPPVRGSSPPVDGTQVSAEAGAGAQRHTTSLALLCSGSCCEARAAVSAAAALAGSRRRQHQREPTVSSFTAAAFFFLVLPSGVVHHNSASNAAGCSGPAPPFPAPAAAAAAEGEGAFPGCTPEGDLGRIPIKREPGGHVRPECGFLPAPDSHEDSSPRLLLEEPGTSSASASVGEDGVLPLLLLSPAVRDRGSHGPGSGHLVVPPLGGEGEGCIKCTMFCSGTSHATSESTEKKWSRWFFLGPRVRLLSLEGQRGWTAERFDSGGALWVRSPQWFRSSMWGLAAVAQLRAPSGRLVRMELHIGRHPGRSASRRLGKRAGRVVKVPFVWWDPHPGASC